MNWTFPNVELVAWLASTAQHNEDYRHLDLIKKTSPRQSSIWLRSMVATGTGGSRHFSIEKAGGSVLAVCTGYGGVTEVGKQRLRGSVCPPTLKVPQKQPKRGRLWLNDGSCVRLRPAHKGHVWSYDFVQDRTHEGKVFRMLCIIDEFTRECLAIRVERRLNSRDVLDELGELFVRHGPPEHIRSDNGPEFIATALREWLERLGTKTLYIEPGSPWENGYCESFNSKLRDELLAREIFYDLREAKVLIEGWRIHYNIYRPHSSLGYKPPAPVTVLPASFIPPYRGRAA